MLIRRLSLITLISILAVMSTAAKVRLTPLFTDNMVFQQDCKAPVWGEAEPGATVKVTPSWNNKTYSAIADSEGKWKITIPTPKGSFQKYSLTISDGEPVVLSNVVVGEVWLASGQSNMQMPVESWRAQRINQEDIENASKYADVRLLQVSRATGMVEHDYFSADFDKWKESAPETVRNFSAAGWYFGRKLLEDLKVPIGIIHSSWGGTIIEAWMSEGAIKSFPETHEQLAKVKSLSDNEAERERTFEEEIDRFYKEVTKQDLGVRDGEAVWARPDFNDSDWKTISLPRKVQELWPATNGIYWFRKEIDIPASWEGHEITLSLGPVDDFDETYWNGELVGSGKIWNKAREYSVPADLVKAGRTVICIRNTDDHGDGGLYGDGSLMFLQGPDGQKISLEGDWKVTLSVSFKNMPKSTSREPNMVTVLYNAMIKPLAPFAIKGAIWYQGESNTAKAYRYRDYMKSLILDWRALWGYDFPFYITQLAGYKPITRVAGDDDWAELREAQDIPTKVLDKVGMACIIDIGEAEDIHPVRKREVGERLARLALANDYGKKVIANGPRFSGYTISGNSVKIRFTDVVGGLKVIPSGDFASTRYGKDGMDSELVTKAESGILTGFQIAGADKVWHWAEARISGSEVIVSSPEVSNPKAVRYGWGANPVCNLFNSEGLPAWPFRTDDWPGITQDKTPTGDVVFQKGENGVHTYRIPAITRTRSGVLLAFAEARHNSGSDTGDIDLVVKRSVDGGKTWGEMITIWDDGKNVCGNPSPVVDSRTGKVILLSTWNDGRDPESAIHKRTSFDTRRVFCLYSEDEGLTWSKPVEITDQAKLPEWTWYATGPSHAVQLPSGRIIVPCNHGNFGAETTSHVIYSDDLGETWAIGGETHVGNECTLARLPKGKLMLNMRKTDPELRQYGVGRLVAVSLDGGLSFEKPYYDASLTEPVCNASLINGSPGRPSKTLFFSNPEHPAKRVNLTLRMSRDSGQNWESVATLTEGPAAYSDLVIMRNKDVGVLYEAGMKSPYEAIYFARLRRKDLK
ncbi:MAG: exo-alpha-sialidase [Bacteroidales bacterium]|nr:exo-alpha-sialidase [Bacteroidales bacterium]